MPTVVLLHGISKTSRIMKRLEDALIPEGYSVRNLNYPSMTRSLETLAELIFKEIEPLLQSDQPLHFVGHSMGAILVRLIIRDHRPQHLGRVVMLGPPNRGSAVVDFLQRFRFYKKFFGPAGQQIGTNHAGILYQLPPANYECGVIAGNRSHDPWFSWFLFQGRPNDGKISVENTKLEGMTDFIVVPVAHAVMPKNKRIIQLVKTFLAMGHF